MRISAAHLCQSCGNTRSGQHESMRASSASSSHSFLFLRDLVVPCKNPSKSFKKPTNYCKNVWIPCMISLGYCWDFVLSCCCLLAGFCCLLAGGELHLGITSKGWGQAVPQRDDSSSITSLPLIELRLRFRGDRFGRQTYRVCERQPQDKHAWLLNIACSSSC